MVNTLSGILRMILGTACFLSAFYLPFYCGSKVLELLQFSGLQWWTLPTLVLTGISGVAIFVVCICATKAIFDL